MKKVLMLFVLLYSYTAFAQDIIITNDGGSIKAYNLEIAENKIFYTLDSISDEIHKLDKSDIMVIKKADGKKIVFDEESQKDKSQQVLIQSITYRKQYGDASLPDVDIANYKGFLLAKGNVVYVLDSDIDYEQAAIDKLRQLISEQGYWKLATRVEQAHFIIRYGVNLKGRDHVYQDIIGRRNQFTKKEQHSNAMLDLMSKFYAIHSSESARDNIEAAIEVFKRIVDIQKKIDKDTPKYLLKLFTYE